MLVVDGEGKIFDDRRKKQRRVSKEGAIEGNERRSNTDRRQLVQTRGKKKK